MEKFVNKILQGSSIEKLKELLSEKIDMCLTSPPYWGLRDYGHSDQLGLEKDFNEYVNKLCNIFDEVYRVLKPEGSCWVNLGDTYSTQSVSMGDDRFKQPKYEAAESSMNFKQSKTSLPDKCLCMIPQRFAIEMINRGWILRNTIIWHKKNAMPSSVKDRFTVDFEYLYFFVKQRKYYFEQQFDNLDMNSDVAYRQALRENKDYDTKEPYKNNTPKSFDIEKKNKRTVWSINTKPFPDAHYAVYPEELCYTPIEAGCPVNGIVLDPFFGSGTTGLVATKLKRNFIGVELNPDNVKMAKNRIQPYLEQGLLF